MLAHDGDGGEHILSSVEEFGANKFRNEAVLSYDIISTNYMILRSQLLKLWKQTPTDLPLGAEPLIKLIDLTEI